MTIHCCFSKQNRAYHSRAPSDRLSPLNCQCVKSYHFLTTEVHDRLSWICSFVAAQMTKYWAAIWTVDQRLNGRELFYHLDVTGHN